MKSLQLMGDESRKIIGTLRGWLVLAHIGALVLLYGGVTQRNIVLSDATKALAGIFIIGVTAAFAAQYCLAIAYRAWSKSRDEIGDRMVAISNWLLYLAAGLLVVGISLPIFVGGIIQSPVATQSAERKPTIASAVVPTAVAPSPIEGSEPHAPNNMAPVVTRPDHQGPLSSDASQPTPQTTPEEQPVNSGE